MTPADKQAVARLTRGIDNGTYGSGYPICKGCGRVWFEDDPVPRDGHGRDCPVPVLLALVREPVASVEAEVEGINQHGVAFLEVISTDEHNDSNGGELSCATWPGAKVGAKVRIDVHAVDEEAPKKTAPCHFCGKPTDTEDTFCHGCKHHICESCDKTFVIGPHTVDDHLFKEGDEE